MSERVPEGWISVKLKDVSVLTKGLTYASRDYSDEQNGLPFLTLKSISKDGGYSPVGLKFYRGEFREQHALNIGDVLLANTDLTRDGDVVGSPLFFDGFGFDGTTLYSMDLSKLKVDPQKTHSKFLYYLLMTHRVKRYMVNSSAGSTVLHLDTNRVKELELSLPPLPEQKKIASILTSVDEVIEKTQSQIDKLQDLKKGTMNELLTKGIGHTEFKDSELGRIPKSWRVKSLVDVCRPKQWKTISQNELTSAGFPVFGANGLIGYFSEFNHEEETIAVTCRGATCGTVNLVPPKTYITGNAMCLDDVTENTCTKYLYYASIHRTFFDAISGSAQPQITGDSLRFINLPFPPLSEQKKIASILTSVDEVIDSLKQKLQQTQSLKKSLMQDLLTGKVRVSVN